ncbi:MAG: glucosaminidase domain-containing protein [Pseudomonadota bacterium]|nr:glucosaminidase domain-containing protein [Pseudomonadota bacterium]
MLIDTTCSRFERVSLGTIGAAVVALYAAVLFDPSMGRSISDAVAAFKAAPPTGETSAPSSDSWVDIMPVATITAPAETVAATGDETVPPPLLVTQIDELFSQVDYRLEDVRLGELAVPRVLLEVVPVDLITVESPAERKRLFIQMALPLVLQANEYVIADRTRLIRLHGEFSRGGAIADSRDRAWLADLAARYGGDRADIGALLLRVDIIPPSLALAQGAEESGWGTSRFVREGNAIFGQRTFTAGAGLVPEDRDADKSHEVRSFDRLLGSVASYMTNLNTHFAYDEFRAMRARQRLSSGIMDSVALVGTLDRYSERGEQYIATIRSIIESNGLRAYDRARLSDGDVIAINQSAI